MAKQVKNRLNLIAAEKNEAIQYNYGQEAIVISLSFIPTVRALIGRLLSLMPRENGNTQILTPHKETLGFCLFSGFISVMK